MPGAPHNRFMPAAGLQKPPAGRSHYFAAEAEFESERARLHLLQCRYDPVTVRRLRALDIGEGASCLEVGAGAGSVASWLAGRVGATGRVVATDIDTRFLDGLEIPNLVVRRHDILSDPIEASSYDLVHCRAVLFHLDNPQRALERMAAAIRPDGWLLVEEADYCSFAAARPDHPLAPCWDRAALAFAELARTSGLFNINVGRRLPALVAALGLAAVGHERIVRVHRGGSLEAEFCWVSLERLRDLLVPQLLTEDDLEQVARAARDPSFAFVGATSVAVWGRRDTPDQEQHRPPRPDRGRHPLPPTPG